MCNLYALRTPAAEVALMLGVMDAAPTNAGGEVYPGRPGLVVHEAGGRRVLRAMGWGLPLRLRSMAPTAKPKPVNNCADLGGRMWRGLAASPAARCLIPLTAFAEAQGPPGAKTRTWFSVRGQPVACWAGLWRDSAEWGPVYAGVMTDANAAILPVHDRMPVLLLPDEQARWLGGAFDDLVALQARPFPPALVAMTRTAEPWTARRRAPAG